MPLASLQTTIQDGALAIAAQDPTSVSAAVGMATAGAFDTIQTLTKAQHAVTQFASGPLVEKCAYHITKSKKPVYAARINGTVGGVISAITKSNPAAPTILATGAAVDDRQIIIEITQTGMLAGGSATGAFKYSVDGGDTETPELALPTPPADTAAVKTGSVNLAALDYPDPAIVTGTGNLSAGALYGGGGTLDGLTVTIGFNNAAPITATLVAPADKADLLLQLNTQYGGAHFTAPGNFLVINSTTIGAAGEIDITGGTGLVALGLVVATTNGDPGDLDGQTFAGTITSVGAFTVTFAAPANAAAVLAEINADVGASVATQNGSGFLVLTSTDTSVAAAVTINVGGTALATLGLTSGTVNGTDPPATYVLGDTGAIITFPQGTYTENDTYTLTTTAPHFTLLELATTLDVFLNDRAKEWFIMHVVGKATTASASRALADALQTFTEDAANMQRYIRAIMELPAVSDADLRTEFVSLVAPRVLAWFGHGEIRSEATRDSGTKRVFTRPGAWALVKRMARIPLSEDPGFIGRKQLDGATPGIDGVVSVPQATLDLAETMNDARFSVFRQVDGKTGVYFARPKTFASPGSDFALYVYARLIDEACRITRNEFTEQLVAKIFADTTTGFIDDNQATAIERGVERTLNAELVTPGHASSATVIIDRTNNIISTQTMIVETRIQPPGYSETIVHTIGFTNPGA